MQAIGSNVLIHQGFCPLFHKRIGDRHGGFDKRHDNAVIHLADADGSRAGRQLLRVLQAEAKAEDQIVSRDNPFGDLPLGKLAGVFQVIESGNKPCGLVA